MSMDMEFESISHRFSLKVKTKESAKASNTSHQKKFNPVKECYKVEDKPSQPQRVHYKNPSQ